MFFKLKFKTIAIAAVIASLLLIGLNYSEAASITYLSVDSNTDYGGGSDFYASLSADENIYYINWYVKQTYPVDQADSDYELVYTSMHLTGTKSVSVRLGLFDGHIKIAEYDIKADVTFEGASDSSTTTTSVYKPVFNPNGYQRTGVYGYSELTAHYFDGSSIVMDGYVSAYNGTGDNARGFGRFRHTAVNKNLDELEDPLPNENFQQGETYGYSTSDWGTFFNFDTGGELQGNDTWVCNAYIRLKVHQGVTDDWLAEDTNTFTSDDNP